MVQPAKGMTGFARVFAEQYTRRAPQYLKRHPDLRQRDLRTLQLLKASPAHAALRLRALTGKHDSCIRYPQTFPSV